jgi:hypothetical protein
MDIPASSLTQVSGEIWVKNHVLPGRRALKRWLETGDFDNMS